MPRKRSDIEFLDPGWQWIPAGEERWTTADGEISTARHGRRGNEVLSTRQVQNIQREHRAERGIPKAPTIPRRGKIRTVKAGGARQRKEQTNVTYTTKSAVVAGVGSLYNENEHGYSETYVFYTFEEAQEWALIQKNIPSFAADDGRAILQVRFTDRLNTTDLPGSDKTGGPGYATLSYLDTPKFFFGNYVNRDRIGGESTPWGIARNRIQNYDMSGPDARVYIYLSER